MVDITNVDKSLHLIAGANTLFEIKTFSKPYVEELCLLINGHIFCSQTLDVDIIPDNEIREKENQIKEQYQSVISEVLEIIFLDGKASVWSKVTIDTDGSCDIL